MDMSKQKLSERNIDDCILLAVLPEENISIFGVQKEVKKELDKKGGYPSVLRHVNKLTQDGLIHKTPRERDKRGTWNLKLTMKGLVYIILNVGLSDADVRKVFQRFIKGRGLNRLKSSNSPLLLAQLPVNVLRKALEDVRPKVNIDFYDEQHATGCITKELLKVATYEATKHLKEHKDSSGKLKFQQGFSGLQETLVQEARRVPEEHVQMVNAVYEDMREEQNTINMQVAKLAYALNIFKLARNGSLKPVRTRRRR
jgi:hypothetical protein